MPRWLESCQNLENYQEFSVHEVSQRNVYRWVKQFRSGNTMLSSKPSGRRRSTTEEQDERIVEKVASEPL